MMDQDERRRKRRMIRALQREATWLQKILFAIGKAEASRETVGDLRGEEALPRPLKIDGREVSFEALEDAFQDRVEELLDTIREMRREHR